jgi:hypothetical protein
VKKSLMVGFRSVVKSSGKITIKDANSSSSSSNSGSGIIINNRPRPSTVYTV